MFPIQRYYGEENKPECSEETAKKNLNLLLEKVKKRQLERVKNEKIIIQKSADQKPDLNNSSINYLEEKSAKKAKREYIKKEESTDNNDENSDTLQGLSVDKDISELLSYSIDKLKVLDNPNEENLDYGFQNNEAEDTTTSPNNDVFPVIGDFKFKKRKKIKRVLPDWLANPSVVSVDLKNLDVSIHDIPELHTSFTDALNKNNISHFFPVQAKVIPFLLRSAERSTLLPPGDVCVSAPTGSGKTLVYALAIIQSLMGSRTGHIQALVVLPVQDLASQVASVLRTYSASTGLRVHLSSWTVPLAEDQSHLLRSRHGVGWESLVDILVITPGRLVEHLYSTPGFSLKHLRYIVIDEADRIVDSLQNNWLYHLEKHLNIESSPLLTIHNLKTMAHRPQKMLFSATLSSDPEKLNQLNLFQPRLFTSIVEADKGEGEFIGQYSTPAELEECMVRCTLAVKPLVLFYLVTRPRCSRVLVFTSSSRSVHQLTALLKLLSEHTQHTLQVAEISSQCSPRQRETVLSNFGAGRVDVLVSTDALARGIDIPDVQYVISYDMPKYIKAYIHRVGRTGRAGHIGVAITMVIESQVGMFRQMLQTAGKLEAVKELKVNEDDLKTLEEPFKNSLKNLKSLTEGEEKKKLEQKKYLKRVPLVKLLAKKRKKRKDGGNLSKKFKK